MAALSLFASLRSGKCYERPLNMLVSTFWAVMVRGRSGDPFTVDRIESLACRGVDIRHHCLELRQQEQ